MTDLPRFDVRIPAGNTLSGGMVRQFTEMGGDIAEAPSPEDNGKSPAFLVSNIPAPDEKLARRKVARIAYVDEDELTATPAG